MTDVDLIQNDEMSFYTANIAILATFEKPFFFTEKRLGKLRQTTTSSRRFAERSIFSLLRIILTNYRLLTWKEMLNCLVRNHDADYYYHKVRQSFFKTTY